VARPIPVSTHMATNGGFGPILRHMWLALPAISFDPSAADTNAPWDLLTTPLRRLHSACNAAKIADMSVAITIRDVPDAVRDELAARAARAGKSLQEYLRGMLVESAANPTVDDVIARARARVAATGVRVDADSILAARDAERH
jgi:antitoxin FitA